MYLNIYAALLLMTPALMTPAAFATSVDLKSQLQSCQQVSDAEQRLNCFEQIVAQLDKLPVAVLAPQSAENVTVSMPTRVTETAATQNAVTTSAMSTTTAAASRSVNDTFGLKKPDPVDELQEIVSLVKSATLDKRKKLLITLKNGQQWQQIDQGYLKIKTGDRCTVARGAIGSFLLGVEGITKTIRVRRVE